MPQPTTPDYSNYYRTIIEKMTEHNLLMEELINSINNLSLVANTTVNVPDNDTTELCHHINEILRNYKQVHGLK